MSMPPEEVGFYADLGMLWEKLYKKLKEDGKETGFIRIDELLDWMEKEEEKVDPIL